MFKNLLNGRFLGHPVHAMLVHFPIGLFTAGVCFDIIAFITGPSRLQAVSFYCFAGGLISGFAAMLFGFIDYINLASNEPLFKKSGYHGLLQFLAFLTFTVVFGVQFQTYPELSKPDFLMLLLEIAAIVLMFAGNFIGGELVYKYGVGTSIRKSD